MWLIFFFLTGFGFAVSGGVTIIAYLNLLPVGLSWLEYLLFIRGRPECYLLPIGIIFMTYTISQIPYDRVEK